MHVLILDKREKNILVNMPTKFRKLARTGSKDDSGREFRADKIC